MCRLGYLFNLHVITNYHGIKKEIIMRTGSHRYIFGWFWVIPRTDIKEI